MDRKISYWEFMLRSSPMLGVGLVVSLSTQVTDVRKLLGLLLLQILFGVATVVAWLVKK